MDFLVYVFVMLAYASVALFAVYVLAYIKKCAKEIKQEINAVNSCANTTE